MTIPPFAEFERYDSSMDLVLSCSGGKDSVAIGIALRTMGIPFRAVFADTGWEHAATYKYLRDVVPNLIGRTVIEVRTEIALPPDLEVLAQMFEMRLGFYSPMVRRTLQYAMFSARQMKWCTRELKLYPMARYLETLDGEPVVVTGIRREESAARAVFEAWEDQVVDITPTGQPRVQSHQTNWRPALLWTYDDVIGVFHHAGIAPNPLYLNGSNRVGCWPCINTSREELRIFAGDKDRVSILRDLERVVGDLAADRAAAKGLGRPSFFQAKVEDKRAKKKVCWTIDRTLTWAKGKPRNPDQAELFWAPADGCARWGLCPATGAPKLFGGSDGTL